MRQLTKLYPELPAEQFSKLPMRQLTNETKDLSVREFSKLPMRQLTFPQSMLPEFFLSKLPMRQLTMLERKKKPTVRALIHLFPTLTQIYSCFEID